MKTYIVESIRYEGQLYYTFNNEGTLLTFSAENATIDNEKLLAIVSMLPPTYNHLLLMVEKAKKQQTIKRFYEHETIVPTFDTFWDAYPRKVAKIEAQNTYNKMKDPEKIKAFMYIKRYKLLADKDGVSYLYPATYLNARRWEDV